MSKNYEMIWSHYRSGAWNINQVYNVVGKAYGITAEEYEKITGLSYSVKE